VSDFSLDLWISCHTKSVFLEDFLRINQGIIFALSQILRRHGARFADRNQREARILREDPTPKSAQQRQRRMVPVGGMGSSNVATGRRGYRTAGDNYPDSPTTYPDSNGYRPDNYGGGGGADSSLYGAAAEAAAQVAVRRESEAMGTGGKLEDEDDDDVSSFGLGQLWRRPRIAIDVDVSDVSGEETADPTEEQEGAAQGAAMRAESAAAAASTSEDEAAAAAMTAAKAAASAERELKALLAYQAELEEALRGKIDALSAREGELERTQQASEAAWERRFSDALAGSQRQGEALGAAVAALQRKEVALAARERALQLRIAADLAVDDQSLFDAADLAAELAMDAARNAGAVFDAGAVFKSLEAEAAAMREPLSTTYLESLSRGPPASTSGSAAAGSPPSAAPLPRAGAEVARAESTAGALDLFTNYVYCLFCLRLLQSRRFFISFLQL